MHSVEKVWTTPSIENIPAQPPYPLCLFIFFFFKLSILDKIFWRCCPNEVRDKLKNKLIREIFSCLGDYKTAYLLCKKHIQFQLITIYRIKRSHPSLQRQPLPTTFTRNSSAPSPLLWFFKKPQPSYK